MKEKTGRVEIGVTADENGRPCAATSKSGEPTDGQTVDNLDKLAAAMSQSTDIK